MKNKKDHVPFASRKELVIIVSLACLNIVLYGVLAQIMKVESVILAVSLALLYLGEVALLGVFREKNKNYVPLAGIEGLLQEKGSKIIKYSKNPVAVVDTEGKLLWCNASMLDILKSEENPCGKDIRNVLDIEFNDNTFNCECLTVGDNLYTAKSIFIEGDNGDNMYVLTFNDITELSKAKKIYNDSRVCVAYIAIDNIEDILQYVHDKFRVAVSSVDDKLKKWADSLNASIKSYENDKYIMFFDSKALDVCIKNRFDILDEIRETRVGDGVSVTVSMGISNLNGTLKEKELSARDAIDMALQRGGDQVVYVENGETTYYGGKTKSIYKRSNVKSRTFANELLSKIARADNVIIMGHRYGDFDSFGASVGVARIAMICGAKVNIAIDRRDKNLYPCIHMMEQNQAFSQMFVDNAEGLELVGPDTLLILVDHNSLARAQFSDIANKVKDVVVIDHHRKVDAYAETVHSNYNEPSASSACELVTEMLESTLSSHNLSKEEADMLLAGILLDTKQFTRNSGTRTFGAAQYLRGAGANPTDVYALFKTDPNDLRKEARFHTAITIYRNNIAISCCDGETDETFRIIASKAADKMLTLKGIEASFTLVRIGEQIHISGRSSGNVNVQLILEKLHGGGHFDVAGAQVDGKSVEDVLETLKSSIDDYFDTKQD